MTDTTKDNLHKFLLALPLGLIAILAICLLLGGSLLFIYAFAIVFAWKSAMTFMVVFASSTLAIGAGLGSIEGFKAYLKIFNRKVKVVLEPKSKTEMPKKRIVTLTNIALCIMLIGSVLAIVSAFLGSIERVNWVKAKAPYMIENGYNEDITKFDISFNINSKKSSTLTIDLKDKNAVVIYDDKISAEIRVTGYISYQNQIETYAEKYGTEFVEKLTILETPSPRLNRVVDKMLFFVFTENKAEKQIRIHIPKGYKENIEIIGKYIEAK